MTHLQKLAIAELLIALHMQDVVKSRYLKEKALNRVRAALPPVRDFVRGYSTSYEGPER